MYPEKNAEKFVVAGTWGGGGGGGGERRSLRGQETYLKSNNFWTVEIHTFQSVPSGRF